MSRYYPSWARLHTKDYYLYMPLSNFALLVSNWRIARSRL
jgi:hypothetical protein